PLGDQPRHDLKILLDIGREVQPATWPQHSRARPGELGGEDASLVVSFLPPRIGEVDVYRLQRPRRHPIAYELARISAGQPYISPPADSHARCGVELQLALDLDTDEVDLGMGGTGVEQEQPLAEANLQLDRVIVAEDGAPVQRGTETGRTPWHLE